MDSEESWEGRATAADARPALPRRLLPIALAVIAVLVAGVLVRAPAPSGRELTIRTGSSLDGEEREGPPGRIVGGAWVHVLHPQTLEDQFRPVPADAGSWIVASEDDHLVAVGERAPASGELARILDARTLRLVGAVPDLDHHGQQLQFSVEGDALVSLVPGPLSPEGDLAMQVERRSFGPAGNSSSVTLPPELVTLEARSLPEGRVGVFALGRDSDGGTTGTPRLLVVDMVDEHVAFDLPLENVVARSPPLPPRQESSEDPVGLHDQPGIGWDVDRERLYVVHSDRDHVTVVDLAAGKVVADAPLGHPDGAPASPAQADDAAVRGPGKHAVVSPDGSQLYVTGWRGNAASSGTTPPRGTSLGVQVIDTSRLQEVGHLDVPALWVLISPNGAWLVVTGTEVWERETAPADQAALSFVTVVRVEGLEEVATHRGRDTFPTGFSEQGSILYVESYEGTDERMLRALALPTLEVVGERALALDASFDPTTGVLLERGAEPS